jgi:hypothetical protein
MAEAVGSAYSTLTLDDLPVDKSISQVIRIIDSKNDNAADTAALSRSTVESNYFETDFLNMRSIFSFRSFTPVCAA